MTILEIILTAIIWVAYGVFSAYQNLKVNDDDESSSYILFIILAPIMLLIRIVLGAFDKKIFE